LRAHRQAQPDLPKMMGPVPRPSWDNPPLAKAHSVGKGRMRTPLNHNFTWLVCVMAISWLAGCATRGTDPGAPPWSGPTKPQQGAISSTPPSGGEGAAEQARLYRGTGQLIKGQLPGGGEPVPPPGPVAAGPAVRLDFAAAYLGDVVRNIPTDILNESYTIAPQVGGTVTIRTSAGIPPEALPATLEMLLRMNGAAMVKEGSIWKILPAASAVRG